MDVGADVAHRVCRLLQGWHISQTAIRVGVSGQSFKDENVCYIAVRKNIYLLHHPMQSRVHP